MSDSKKVTRKKSLIGTLAGIFRKKRKESDSISQGHTSPGSSSDGSQKSPKRDVYRMVNNADATSCSGTPKAPGIDPSHVSTAANNGHDTREESPKTAGKVTQTVIMDRNDHRTAGESNSEERKPERSHFFNETELVETFSKDLRIPKRKINNTDGKIVINQMDNGAKTNVNAEKVEVEPTGDSNEEKISSEIMKRKWFNDEIVVPKSNPVVVVVRKDENGEKTPIVVPEFALDKSKEVIVATGAIIKDERHEEVGLEHDKLVREETQLLIQVEKRERIPENDYFKIGKYASFFLLQIERQYHDPAEVYSMVRYRDPEDSDDSDSEGENSSSESTSPNIPFTMRRRLLHRRSVDNLLVNSPTNSMRHSSPESVKSAPVQLKPRSTSHDALAKRRDKQSSQNDGVSMDSLAKQSLLAARVLNLIPTQQARERNFLHGRIAANSLLGPVELEKVLPQREVKIFVGTWNMNGQSPPKELNDFMLPAGLDTIPDLLAIGTQESYSEKTEWESALQETLGPSHVMLTSTSLGTLHMALFVRRDLIWFCSVPEESYFSTRTGTAFRTKGAVALAVMLFGTSFLFVTAHLTAHQDKVKERVNDIRRIIRNLDLPKDLPTKNKSKDVTQNFDCVFWCGDLNFRLALPREDIVHWISETTFPQEHPINLDHDQLRTTLNEGMILKGFQEAPIVFPPTYKYDPGSQNFDSSGKQRSPAYTDRILFKGKGQSHNYTRSLTSENSNSQKDGVIECLIYDSVPSICTSDHKPVWGVFKTTVRPGIDTIPLAAGMFNRDVYLEGIKRRAAAMDDGHGMSRTNSRNASP